MCIRDSLRTLPGASLRPSLGFNPRPRRLSTPTDAFELHPDVSSQARSAAAPKSKEAPAVKSEEEEEAKEETGEGEEAREPVAA